MHRAPLDAVNDTSRREVRGLDVLKSSTVQSGRPPGAPCPPPLPEVVRWHVGGHHGDACCPVHQQIGILAGKTVGSFKLSSKLGRKSTVSLSRSDSMSSPLCAVWLPCSAWPQGCPHRWTRSFLVRPPWDNEGTSAGPSAPSCRRPNCRRAGGTCRALPTILATFCKDGWTTRPSSMPYNTRR